MALPGARTADDYLAALRQLSPPGIAFGDEEGRWDDLLEALAQELGRADASAANMIAEMDPRTADETIAAWEYMLGLEAGSLSLALRREQAHAALIATGGQSPAYFVELAAALGMTITITSPVSVGWSPSSPPCAPLYSVYARFVWLVTGPVGASAGRRQMMEDLFNRLKPAHTVVAFEYV